MDELMARQPAQPPSLMLGSFGVLGVVIAAVGILGLMAYVVAQRTREIGVWMALGATRSRVMAMAMSKTFTLVFARVILGSAGARYLEHTARTLLFALEALATNSSRSMAVAWSQTPAVTPHAILLRVIRLLVGPSASGFVLVAHRREPDSQVGRRNCAPDCALTGIYPRQTPSLTAKHRDTSSRC
jgi:hypothetical protein